MSEINIPIKTKDEYTQLHRFVLIAHIMSPSTDENIEDAIVFKTSEHSTEYDVLGLLAYGFVKMIQDEWED